MLTPVGGVPIQPGVANRQYAAAMQRVLRVTLLVWGVFDVATGVISIADPDLVREALWPTAEPDALIMIRRAGVFWLMTGCVQLAAFRKFPCAELLRLVALLRVTDGIADIVWLSSGTAFSGQGYRTIGPSPALCFIVAWLAWRAARATSVGVARGSSP
jgi:hypothetical protein